jgi:hypothetical protein
MKVQVTFKSPEAMHYLLDDLDPGDRDSVAEVTEKYVLFGEMLRVEFDTDTGTATVLQVGE